MRGGCALDRIPICIQRVGTPSLGKRADPIGETVSGIDYLALHALMQRPFGIGPIDHGIVQVMISPLPVRNVAVLDSLDDAGQLFIEPFSPIHRMD